MSLPSRFALVPLGALLPLAAVFAQGPAVQSSHLVFPNYGLNAIQEFDPVTRTVIQTIPIPTPYTLQGSIMLLTILVRQSDHAIFVNVRNAAGDPGVLVLNDHGQFVAEANATSNPGWFLQQMAFDPLDATQSAVLGGVPFFPEIRAVNPFVPSVTARVATSAANFIGLTTDSQGHLYAGDFSSGQAFLYANNGTALGSFADVLAASGSGEINGMARDSAGNLYVAQNTHNRVLKFSSTGALIATLTSPAFNQPSSPFFNPNDGLLYVGNQGDGNVVIVTPSGTQAGVATLGGQTIGVAALVPGSCQYSIAPSLASFGASGGSGDVVVNTSPGCAWTALSNADWITLDKTTGQGAGFVSYSVSANSTSAVRTGVLSIAGNAVTLTEAGTLTCSYAITPGSQTVGMSGAAVFIAVSAPAGCNWSASSALPWAMIVSSATGSGTGGVEVQVAANGGAPRSGTLSVAGQAFSLSQAAGACGAADVSDKVTVTQGAMVLFSVVNSLYSRRITLANATNQAISGPIYLVLDGLPKSGPPGCANGCTLVPAPPVTHCQSPSVLGSYLVLWSPSGLGPGQSIAAGLTFFGSPTSLLQYTTRVLSGTPNQ